MHSLRLLVLARPELLERDDVRLPFDELAYDVLQGPRVARHEMHANDALELAELAVDGRQL
eukprot:scaffold23606_cov108-Isochrysis_galbana.AAC.2